MSINEVIAVIQNYATFENFAFVVVRDQQVNQYITRTAAPKTAIIMLEPPTYAGQVVDGVRIVKKYNIYMHFMIHVAQDSSYDDRQDAVEVADQYCNFFLGHLNQNTGNLDNLDNSELQRIQVTPYHRYPFNAMHVAGVTLEFDLLTEDTFNYCSLEEFEAGIGYWTIGETFTVS